MQHHVLRLFTVDAFSNVPFHGNPAAVCIDSTPQGLSDEMMHSIAAEMNISETAFVRVQDHTDFSTSATFLIRWFTPTSEVPLCGHATLATSAVLFNKLGNLNEQLEFVTQANDVLQATRKLGNRIGLVLPLNPPVHVIRDGFEDIIRLAVGNLPVTDLAYSAHTKKFLIRLDDSITRAQLESLDVNTSKLTSCTPPQPVRGVIVTLKAGDAVDAEGTSYDFISRYYAPWVSIPEDPVTGAAHTVLAAYWSQQLQKTSLYARQCSPRGGDLALMLREDGRLDVSGTATIVVDGEITIPATDAAQPNDTKDLNGAIKD